MIVKPDQLSQGKGIYLTNTLEDLEYEIFKSRAYDDQNMNLGKQNSGNETE